MSAVLQAMLQAGGMVPANAKLGKADVVDVVVARAYSHAVLPGRTVIRLSAESVVAGDDLEMATLGFGPPDDRGAVAKERKRPLGFPGWALVHDPQNARYALDVMKEFKKQARKARSKPGHAKEGIDAIAAKLGKSVPHFLPAFFEEAGRVFIEHGAPGHAATMFGKAREAEAVHALEVDEQHRVEGFLEFALAGAVTTKALTQYAKQLAENHQPAVAYAHFRQLCLQRTLGGMPPWSGMSKELHRLAKAAKLDCDAEDAAFITEIIESPALGKAASEFWRAYAGPIAAYGTQSASARGALLNLFPTGAAHSTDLDDAWLDLLDATGASRGLISDDVPVEAKPSGGTAAWFDKLTQHLARSWRDSKIGVRAFAVLRRLAPRLIADGTPIGCVGRYHRMDLDLVELALELGVAVQPPEHARFDLDAWGKHAAEPERGRDPVRAAAHLTLGPLLRVAVAGEMGDEPWESASRGTLGFLEAKRAWLEAVIAGAEQGALPAIESALVTIKAKVKAETFAELPELYARFTAIDVAPLLARSLRIGIIDELGWPALEAADLELDPDAKHDLSIHGGPPAIVLATKTRAIAVAATARLGEHDLVIPPSCQLATIRFIAGEFLVVLKEGHKVRAYWSSAPHDVFDSPATSAWSLPTLVSNAAVLADGAWIESMVPMRRGERTLSIGGSLAACDGTTSWANEHKDGVARWREITAGGELGRTSWPSWIEAAAEPGWQIDPTSYLYPAPCGVTASPLGVVDGMVGARIRHQGKARTKRELEMIDGTKWTASLAAKAMLHLPDGGEPRPLVDASSYGQPPSVSIYDPTGSYAGSVLGADRRYFRGQVGTLPLGCWHLLVPRDEPGSRRLRALGDADARALMAAVPITTEHPSGVVHPEPPGIAASVLAEVSHPRLLAGVSGLTVMAVQLRLERDRLAADRAPGTAAQAASAGPDDASLLAALAGWTERQWSPQGRAWTQIEHTGRVFASEDRSDRAAAIAPPSNLDWLAFAVAPWSLAFIATAIGTPVDKRPMVAQLLAHLVGSLPPTNQLRVLDATGEVELLDNDSKAPLQLRWHAGNAYALRRIGWHGNHFGVLEYAPASTFKLLPGLAIASETRGTIGPSTADIAAVMAAVTDGKTSWSAAAAERLTTATGLTPSETTFLLAGCPNANDRSANFLDKTLRETLGLKAAQAAVARDATNTVPLAKRLAVIDEAARGGVAALVDGTAIDGFAAAWRRIVGVRAAVDEALVAEASDLDKPMEPGPALAMIASADESPQLTLDGTWAFEDDGSIIRANTAEPLVGQPKLDNPGRVFDAATLQTIIQYIPFLYAALPVGDALRAQAVRTHALVLARLANPALWFDAGSLYLSEDAAKAMDRMLDGLSAEPVVGFAERYLGRRLPGALVMRWDTRLQLLVQPAMLDARARTIVDKLAAQIPTWGVSTYKALEYVRSEELAAIVARIANTPVPDGSWEQNPLASVPALVELVAKQRAISREAAALYLQYLVLLAPTAKNLARFNGWKPRQLDAACTELLEHELILEAKRERAGRAYFLPGGWEALKLPHPPMESWKLAFYGARTADGAPTPPFLRFQALSPFHVLFERAWHRIESGDVPRYEEVKR